MPTPEYIGAVLGCDTCIENYPAKDVDECPSCGAMACVACRGSGRHECDI